VLAAERAAGDQEIRCIREADDAREQEVRCEFGCDAATRERERELGIGGDEPDVALQGVRETGADRVAVDRAQHGLAHLVRLPAGALRRVGGRFPRLPPPELMSLPAQNAGGAPVSTTTRTSSSSAAAAIASASSACICHDIALRRSGRSSVITRT
jgi:hypothetical protein